MARTVPSGDSGHRFPDFDALDQARAWDPVTSAVVFDRLALQPDLRFFGPAEEAVASALFDLLLAQEGPPEQPRVPVLQMVDSRLAEGQTDGWHYQDMPEDGEAWRRSLHALDQDARERHGTCFAELTADRQRALVQRVQDLSGERWHDLPADRVWSLWTRYACTAFYAHPWAWNEIGFPGPAYPRGYLRLGVGVRERWEHPDRAPEAP
ncbi:gluconate 2-dehydrogenase subunit 3 family protein [Kitasatospora sp. RB6PN24]|uniref:gluconate 2-dehydrogenase subunit 3 family protein n=1 Tax=Kitasatospora humi TaxID=2893891 RepID=UPI001E602C0B|nr:gluconate 2-dehydrogenase subunit 3 family protein [Kitasatospora humi]MCC9305787.1 gluconate 2-dehydrogenase subunit 3 family protein [Kitasatospora humi]